MFFYIFTSLLTVDDEKKADNLMRPKKGPNYTFMCCLGLFCTSSTPNCLFSPPLPAKGLTKPEKEMAMMHLCVIASFLL